MNQIKYISECLNVPLDEILFLNSRQKNYREDADSELYQQYMNLKNLDKKFNTSEIKKVLNMVEKEILRCQMQPQLYTNKDEHELIKNYNMIENQVTKWQIIGKLIEIGKKEARYSNNIIHIDFKNKKRL